MSLQIQKLCSCYKQAFSWINQHRDMFNPLEQEEDENVSSLYRTKALGELGLLCWLYYRCTPANRELEIERCLHLMREIWHHAEYQERIVRRPEHFQLHTMVYVVLQQCNMISESYKATIQQVIDQKYAIATETTPMRILDRRHLLDGGKFTHTLPSYEDLYTNTLLAKEPAVVYLTDADVYVITHTLFYLTDFGRVDASVLSGNHLLVVRDLIETLLGLYVRRQHWDLVGELLLDCYCMHWYPDIIFSLACENLLEAQLEDGSFPGPRFSEERLSHLHDAQKISYCFEQNYHTTIVGAITIFLLVYDIQHPTRKS